MNVKTKEMIWGTGYLLGKIFFTHIRFVRGLKGHLIGPFILYVYSEYNDTSIFFKKYF